MFIFTASLCTDEGEGGIKRQGVRALDERLLGEEGASEGLHIIRTINSTLSGRLPTRAIKQ